MHFWDASQLSICIARLPGNQTCHHAVLLLVPIPIFGVGRPSLILTSTIKHTVRYPAILIPSPALILGPKEAGNICPVILLAPSKRRVHALLEPGILAQPSSGFFFAQ